MAYERLSDEESRARVAAIIAAAEKLANDEVPAAPTAVPAPPSQVAPSAVPPPPPYGGAPTYQTPAYETPAYQTPAYQTPGYPARDVPTQQVPVLPTTPVPPAPGYETPGYQPAPAYQPAPPAYETPGYQPAPAYELPAYQTPAVEPTAPVAVAPKTLNIDEGAGYKRWAIAIAAGALVLGGLVIWSRSGTKVTPDQGDRPVVLTADELAGSTTLPVSIVPGDSSIPSSTLPGIETTAADPNATTVPTTPGIATTTPSGGVVATTPTGGVATTVPGSTATTAVPATTTAPATTVPAVTTIPPAVTGTEGPHGRNSLEVESFVSYVGRDMVLVGRVPTQQVSDTMAARAQEFLPADTFQNLVEVDPAAAAPIPIFELPIDAIFEGDTATIKMQFAPQIVQMATALKNHPSTTISIYVHTDDLVDAATALQRTAAQAESLRQIFLAQGIANNRIFLFPKGSTELLGDSSTPEGLLLNRRLEFVVNGLYN